MGFYIPLLPDSNPQEDLSDRMNFLYSPLLLKFFAVFTTLTVLVGEPIKCWVPAHFVSNHETYAQWYCWVHNTYYLPFDQRIPKEHETEDRQIITYYQWVAVALLVQAALFALPGTIWRGFNRRSGLDIPGIIEKAKSLKDEEFAKVEEDEKEPSSKKRKEIETDESEERKWKAEEKKPLPSSRNLYSDTSVNLLQSQDYYGGFKIGPLQQSDVDKYLREKEAEEKEMRERAKESNQFIVDTICEHMHRYLRQHMETDGQRRGICSQLLCVRKNGTYLFCSYVIVKILYLVNILTQFFLLNSFLGTDFNVYGFDLRGALATGDDWMATPRFPRVTMCDFKVRRLGNVQRYTVQCALPINLYNEKIYFSIWCWMFLVAAMTVFSLAQWLAKLLLFPKDRHRYVRNRLRQAGVRDPNSEGGSGGGAFLRVASTGQEVTFKEVAAKFTDRYLKRDGIFTLRLVEQNLNTLASCDIMRALWENYTTVYYQPLESSPVAISGNGGDGIKGTTSTYRSDYDPPKYFSD